MIGLCEFGAEVVCRQHLSCKWVHHLYRCSTRGHSHISNIIARHTDPMDEGEDPRRAQEIQYQGRFFPREQSDSQGLWKPSSTKSQLEVLPRDEGDEWNSKFSPFKGGSWT